MRGQAYTLSPPGPPLSSLVNDAQAIVSVTTVNGHKIQALLLADVFLVNTQTNTRGKATVLASVMSAALHQMEI